jgi:hypothetical protein
MFRRPQYRGLQQQQVSNENEASSRHGCVVAAAGECSLGRSMLNILRHIRRISLVQHDVSMMRAKVLISVAALVLHASAAHATEQKLKLSMGN